MINGAFKSDYLEIGCTMCAAGVEYDSDIYNAVIENISQYTNPDAFMGMAKTLYPNNSGRHGEGSIVTYVRDIIFDYQ